MEMKTDINPTRILRQAATLAVILLMAGQSGLVAAEAKGGESRSEIVTMVTKGGGGSGTSEDKIIVKAIEPTDRDWLTSGKDLPWLGITTEEASEALASQLGLSAGAGLVVSYLVPDSPAAKAGLEKNDVLVEFDGQMLVHPAQLRKLVRVRKEGDPVKLVVYRGGKQQTLTATLAKNTSALPFLGEDRAWQGDLRELQVRLKELPVGEAIREQMKGLRESLGHIHIDRQKALEEARRNIEHAIQTYKDAMRHVPHEDSALGPVHKALSDLAKAIGLMDPSTTTVTVKSTDQSAKSIVKTDDAGTIVLVNKPKLHLTAHDKDGKVLFEGDIQTPEQQAKVPRDLWNKVEPLLNKMGSTVDEDVEQRESKPATF
jgi:membrane-associated protease RseP (regulator of RpoE activity)